MRAVSDDILNSAVLPEEVDAVSRQIMMELPGGSIHSVGTLADGLGMKPLLVARRVLELRGGTDTELASAIDRNDFLIKKLGTARLSAEMVAGDRRLMDKFWRNNDPLGVYRPGDMFYVDDNHPWMPYFPILILAPSALLALVVTFGFLFRVLLFH
jgi:hypothetical protein